ncbi:DUF1761 domain-containing protein [Paeniglutamicibacter antarcticus]|uniref:DUF1761 domain-containing protein n=1 Tax=Paeniglutamicibacter antarcticus TaxID=494023 RepID=UPI0031EF124A
MPTWGSVDHSWGSGSSSGALGWLGLTLARGTVEYLFERRPASLFIIDMGHRLIVVVAMAGIIGVFGA